MKISRQKINFRDARGTITDILDDVPVNAVTIITSKKGVSRGNHYHKKSVQYTYIISGRVKYLSRKGAGKVRSAILPAGGLAISPPGEAHTVVALADTVFLSITKGPRHGRNYEADTYRLAVPLRVSAAPELTVLTLTLNESSSLESFFNKMKPAVSAVVGDFELLIVDGGSSDNTVDLALKGGARVVQQTLPGYGNAYREGLALAKGKYILTLDADSAHPMELFGEFWRQREAYSVVMGSRYLPGGSDARPAGRKLLSRALNFAYRTVLLSPLTDISGGFRLYRAEDVQKMPSEALYYDVVAELIAKLWGSGYKIHEIPYHYMPRQHGESKARVLRFGFFYGLTLLKLRVWLSTRKTS